MGRGRAAAAPTCATRLGLAPVMLWLIASLVFLLLRVAPGDPVDAVLGSRAPAERRRRRYADPSPASINPWGKQYLDFLWGHAARRRSGPGADRRGNR